MSICSLMLLKLEKPKRFFRVAVSVKDRFKSVESKNFLNYLIVLLFQRSVSIFLVAVMMFFRTIKRKFS